MDELLGSCLEGTANDATWISIRQAIQLCYGLHPRHHRRVDDIKKKVEFLQTLVEDVFAQIRSHLDSQVSAEKVFFAYHVQDVKDRVEAATSALQDALVPYTWDKLPVLKPVSYRRRLIEAYEELNQADNGPLSALLAMLNTETGTGASSTLSLGSEVPYVTIPLPSPRALDPRDVKVYGVDDCLGKVKGPLLRPGSASSSLQRLVGICGMGGIGKTTLAHHIYEDEDVKSQFSGGRFWVPVSKNVPVLSVVNKLWGELRRGSASPGSSFHSVEDGMASILAWINSLRGSVLLVLDDVWHENQVKPILDMVISTPLSCQVQVLMTTRHARVVNREGTFWYEARPLSEAQSASMICFYAFGEEHPPLDPAMTSLVEGVCKECQGLPLALKLVGSSLHGAKASQWKVAYRSLRKAAPISRKFEESAFSSLSFSLDALYAEDPVLLDCFVDLAAYPEDYEIPVHELLLQWSSYDDVHGMEDALDLFMTLVDFTMVSWSESPTEDLHDPEHSWSMQWQRQAAGRVLLDLGSCTFHDDVLRDLGLMLSTRLGYTGWKGSRLTATELMDAGVEIEPQLLDRLYVAGGRCCAMESTVAPHCLFHGWGYAANDQNKDVLDCRQKVRLEARNLSLVGGGFAAFDSVAAARVSLEAPNLQVLLCQGTRDQSGFLLEQLIQSSSGLRVLNVHNCRTGVVQFNLSGLTSSLRSLQVFDLGTEFVDEFVSQWPDDFGQMGQLRYLDVRQNIVIGISEEDWLQEVCKLTSLTTLRLDSVRFEDNALGDIPSAIGNLRNLCTLSAASCGITSIPEEISSLSKLSFLDLSDNELSDLPQALGDLKSLTFLDLYKNPISEVPSTIGQLPQLTTFRVGGWGCPMRCLPRSMCQLTSLVALWLGALEEDDDDDRGEANGGSSSRSPQLTSREDMRQLLSCLPRLKFLCLTWPSRVTVTDREEGGNGSVGGIACENNSRFVEEGGGSALDHLEELILCEFPTSQPSFIPRCSRLLHLSLEGGYLKRECIKGWNFRPLPHLQFVSVSCIGDVELPLSLLELPELGTLRLEDCSSLTSIDVGGLHRLRVLDVRNCPSLTGLDVGRLHELETLELRNCASLLSISVGSLEHLQVLRLLSCRFLRAMSIGNMNKVQVVELIGCPALDTIDVRNLSQLRVFLLEECCALTSISFGKVNQVQSVELTECTLLKHIDLGNLKHLQKLKLDGCLSLETIDVSNLTSLQSFIVSGCSNLMLVGNDVCPIPQIGRKPMTVKELCHLQKLDLSDCASLMTVDIGRLDRLQDLLLSDCPNLHTIRGIASSKLQSLYYERVHPDLDKTLQTLCQLKGKKLQDCTVRYGRTGVTAEADVNSLKGLTS